jgi:hypothetical protein
VHGGSTLSGQRPGALGKAVEADLLAFEQPRIADGESVALDRRDRAEAGDSLEVLDRRGRRPRWSAALTIA